MSEAHIDRWLDLHPEEQVRTLATLRECAVFYCVVHPDCRCGQCLRCRAAAALDLLEPRGRND